MTKHIIAILLFVPITVLFFIAVTADLFYNLLNGFHYANFRELPIPTEYQAVFDTMKPSAKFICKATMIIVGALSCWWHNLAVLKYQF